MNSILISIKPEYCELIAKSEKTIEVRKTKPKILPPFKVYIYCTKNGLKIYSNEKYYVTDSLNILNNKAEKAFEKTSHFSRWNGKVIGEFVCDKIIEINPDDEYCSYGYDIDDDTLTKTMLTQQDLMSYGKGKMLYGWHISDLKIYDKPKDLNEFFVEDKDSIRKCKNREQNYYAFTDTGYIKNGFICTEKDDWCFGGCKKKPLTRPPQSWCYVKGA